MKNQGMRQEMDPRPNSLEYWANVKPSEIVAIDEARAIRWEELNDEADRLAECLSRAGVGAGDIIGIRTQIRVEWAVAFSALSKLGCTLLGVNWRLSGPELNHLLSDAGAIGLICDDADPQALLEALSSPLRVVVSLGGKADGAIAYEEVLALPLVKRVSIGDAPFIIYTSGTTGSPKGVVMGQPPAPENAAIHAEYAQAVSAIIPRSANDVMLLTLPLSHSAGPAQVRRTLTFGSKVVMMRKFEPEAALGLIEKHGVTIWISVPTMLNRIAALSEEVTGRYDVSSLNGIQVGGAPIAPTVKRRIGQIFGSNVLHETYGSTETGMVCHLPPELIELKPAACGVGFPHTLIEIRDADRKILPQGEVGGIWVRTPVIISNYLNMPPLGLDVLDERGFFFTGDAGYLDSEATLFITDRIKDMIVSGGVNIYPAEIEAVLHEHAGVQGAAVIGIPDEDFGEQVKAFVELAPGANARSEELLEMCRTRLAGYKVPRSLEIIAQLPRNDTGKVLKRTLREPFWAGRARAV